MSSTIPIRSFADLLERARVEAEKLTYSMIPGTLVHLLGEWINIEAGTSILGVPPKDFPLLADKFQVSVLPL